MEHESIPVTKEKIDSLRKCIENKIKSYKVRRTRNKIGAILVQVSIISFSFGTTVFIGWKLSNEASNGLLKINIALVLSALATGISTLDKFLDFKPLWIGYNISIASLKSALSKLDYLASLGPNTLKRHELDEVFNQYEIVCANMDKNYQEIRSARDE